MQNQRRDGRYSDLTDSTLVSLSRGGDELAWSTIVGRYSRLVYGAALRAGLGAAEAADVVTGVFGELLDALPDLDGRSLRGWLSGATRLSVGVGPRIRSSDAVAPRREPVSMDVTHFSTNGA